MTQYTKPTVLPAWAESAGGADVLQPSNAEIQAGWPLSNVPPSRKRFNWVLKYLAQGVRYLLQRGIPEWDSAEDYRVNDRVMGSDGKTYKAILTGINKDPTTQPTYWTRWGFTLAELNAEGTTPPQFDNDTSLATTAFVQRALGNFAVGDSFAQDETLSAAKTGRHLLPNSTTITRVYLPSASDAGFTLGGRGEAYHIQNTASQAIAVAPQSSDSILVSGSSSGAGVALSLPVGAEVTLVRISNIAWAAFGTGVLKNSADFGFSLAANGYQKLPSGLIIQWGIVTCSTGGAVTWTYPIAFSSVVRVGPIGVFASVAQFSNIGTPTLTSVPVSAFDVAGARTSNTVNMFAIGY